MTIYFIDYRVQASSVRHFIGPFNWNCWTDVFCDTLTIQADSAEGATKAAQPIVAHYTIYNQRFQMESAFEQNGVHEMDPIHANWVTDHAGQVHLGTRPYDGEAVAVQLDKTETELLEKHIQSPQFVSLLRKFCQVAFDLGAAKRDKVEKSNERYEKAQERARR